MLDGDYEDKGGLFFFKRWETSLNGNDPGDSEKFLER